MTPTRPARKVRENPKLDAIFAPQGVVIASDFTGPVYAKKLVRGFGEQVFDIIEEAPQRLREPGRTVIDA